jgi:glycine/D-amino acid oxidase-like deaminating enzyme
MRARQRPADDEACGWLALLPAAPPPRRLRGDVRADCAVVGAGFTGLAAARRLAELRPDSRVVVLEAQRVASGASGRNSGFAVDVGHHDRRLGLAGNRRLTRLARAGIEQLRRLVRRHGIACDWTERGRLHGAVGDAGMRSLETFRTGLEAMDEPFEWLDRAAMTAVTGTSHYRAGVRTPGSVMIQPAALVRGLAATLPGNVELFEHTPVRAIRRGPAFRIDTDAGAVLASRLVLATNGYTPALGFLRRQVFPMFTFASLTRALTPEELATLGGDAEWGLVSEARMGTTVRRTRDGRILIRNTALYPRRLEITERLRAGVGEAHGRAFRARFPMLAGVPLEHTWAGVMGMSMNGMQFFGRVDRDLFAAAGYNGVGVAMGTISGTLLADLALGADSPLLADMQMLPGPAWIPPEPLLGVGVRATLARLESREKEEM